MRIVGSSIVVNDGRGEAASPELDLMFKQAHLLGDLPRDASFQDQKDAMDQAEEKPFVNVYYAPDSFRVVRGLAVMIRRTPEQFDENALGTLESITLSALISSGTAVANARNGRRA